MFLDNLSASLLQICAERNLSYEKAAELCGCSARYFGDIVRKKSAPSLRILEGICIGLQTTPNELFGVVPPEYAKALALYTPVPVTALQQFHFDYGDTTFPICPTCGITFEREYQHYCDRCGQRLSWDDFEDAVIIQH